MNLSKPSGFGDPQPIKKLTLPFEFMTENIVILFSQQVLTNCVTCHLKKKFPNQSNNIIQYIILCTNTVNLQLFWMVKFRMQFLKIEFLKLSPNL